MIRRLINEVKGPKPTSPYTKEDPEFREQLAKVKVFPLLQGLLARLEKRYGLRSGSLGNAILVLSVVLTSGFVYFDTVSDTLISVDQWARPIFLPPLWAALNALRYLIRAVQPPQDEIDPKPEYTGDEIKQAFSKTTGSSDLSPYLGDEASHDATLLAAAAAHAQLTEVASRTHHDRVGLHAGRYYRRKSLKWVMRSAFLFTVALSVYAVGGYWL